MQTAGSRMIASALFRAAGGLALIAAAAANAAAGAFNHVYAFGDSYADNGAALRVSQQAVAAHVPEAVILPAPPESGTYWAGRWSNGPAAVENLAAAIGVGLSDYAVGGAKSGDGNYYAWLDYFRDTGLLGQVHAYLEGLRGGHADPHALYVLSASANDYFQLADFGRTEPVPVAARRAAANTAHAVQLLVAADARTVMVSGAYLLDAVPAVAGDAKAAALAAVFARTYDAALKAALRTMAGHKGVRIVWFEWDAAMRLIADQGARWGLSELRAPCQVTLPKPLAACANPDAYFWWDEYHPSRRTHQLIAAAMARRLAQPGP